MTRSTPAIEVGRLSQSYGALRVVHDVSFQVEPGEIYGFIGPNGAGKTTTIRTMATLLSPTAGFVKICGVDANLEPSRVRKLIGYMPDQAGVYERLTVREYLEFFALACDVDDPEVAEAVLELTDLTPLAECLLVSLSKGMRQRLQLARALLHDPQVLILDEPASDLDPRGRIEIRDLLLELRELGKTILLSSHILSELSDVCTSVGILEQGRLLVSGPIGDIAGMLFDRQDKAIGADVETQPIATPFGEQKHGDANASEAPSTSERTPGGALVPAGVQHGLKLRVMGDSFRLEPLLRACPPITQIETLGGGQVRIRYIGSDQFVAELVKYIVSHGLLLVSVEPERNDLERVFLEITRGNQG